MIRFHLRPLGMISALLAGVFSLVIGAADARADPPVWHVHGRHAEITLFGSVHLLSAATQWKTLALTQDLAKADQVWFEIPLDAASQAEVGAEAVKLGMLPAGQTLSSLLPAPLQTRVAGLAKADGVSDAVIERMRPWMAELMLSQLYFQRLGADGGLGVEAQLAKSAPSSASREAFETIPEQIHLFADDPTSDQVASLTETLDEIDEDPGLFGRMTSEWSRGDTRALVDEMITPMKRDTPGVYQRLLVARNRRFAARIEQMLNGSQRVFVVVGVGHLIGPDSVPALLRRDGIKVDGP